MKHPKRLTSLEFGEWIEHIFDHPGEGPIWYHDYEAPWWDGPPAVTLEYTTRLFESPRPLLDRFTDSQLGRALWYLIGASGHNYMEVLDDRALPIDARLDCVRSMVTLFRDVFAARCVDQLGHLDRDGNWPLNTICYMWWDVITFHPAPAERDRAAIDFAALGVMDDILSIDSLACRESALHGLGHWNHAYPAEVARIIDRFLASGPVPEPLDRYARVARSGCIL